jgi:hypothetical protein
LNSKMIWKMRKKSKLKCEMIWKIWKKSKMKSEKIWKIWRKSKLNSELFTFHLTFLPYFPCHFTFQFTFLPHFPYHFTIKITFLPYFFTIFFCIFLKRYGRKPSWILERYGKYIRKLWKDMEIMKER